MITSPLLSAARDRVFGQQPGAAFLHPVPPSDPARQAQRLPIKVLKMLTARSGHILHPEYLQPLPSTPVSPIELDAKKSPLALLAQTCSQIGKPDPSPSSKLSSSSSSSCGDKDKAGPLKLSDIGAEDKSSFKPYSKQSESGKKESGADKAGFRVPSAACPPFTPRTGSPSSLPSHSPLPADAKAGEAAAERKEAEAAAKESPGLHGRLEQEGSGKGLCSESPRGTPTSSASSVSALGGGLVAPVSPYKPGQSVFPLPPASLSYAGSLASAYGGYSPQFLQQHGAGLEHAKAGLGCGKGAGSSPLAGASPPAALMTASLCRDPYCLSYHCGGGGGSGGGAPPEPLKAYPFMYGAAPPPLGLHPQHPLSGHPLYPYGFMLPNEPQPHVCNWVSASGPCDKRFPSSEELLAHLRTHTAFSGADKLLASYPGSSSSLAAAMACHMHLPPSGGSPGPLTLRSPHHHAAAAAAAAAAYGLSSRYHPYSKSPLQPGAPLPLPASAQGHYYSPYALYGQRLTTASALGYQ